MSSITETESGVVYLLTSPSGKQYVGQTWDYETRMTSYRRGCSQSQRILFRAIAKYGWGNFTAVKIVQGIETQDLLDKIETAYIKAFNTLVPNGYNMTTGGEGGKPCAETRKKMSESQRGNKNRKGKPHSHETRKKLSAKLSGGKHSPETRAKISASLRDNKNRKSKKASPETKAKMRASQLARRARERSSSDVDNASVQNNESRVC